MILFYFSFIICRPTPSIAVCDATSHHVGESSHRLVICDLSFAVSTGVGAITMDMAIVAAVAWPCGGLTSSSSSLEATTSSTSSTFWSTTIMIGGVCVIRLRVEAYGVHICMYRGEKLIYWSWVDVVMGVYAGVASGWGACGGRKFALLGKFGF